MRNAMIRKFSVHIHYPLSLLACLLLMMSGVRAQADEAAGEALFKQNCSSCHKVQGVLVGPQLAGASAKYEQEWLYSWIKNSAAMIKSGDPQAVAVWEQYNKQAMTAFPFLSNEDIDNILAWVDAEDERLNNPPEPVVAAGDGAGAGGGINDPAIYYALLGLVGVLVLIALMLVVITATLVSAVRAKDGQEPLTFGGVMNRTKLILSNKFVLTAIVAFVAIGGTSKAVIEARTIGLHQGYMPEQPIKFSHKLHAGQYQIDCEYCHSGVSKSKNAWIPSVNVCMNCHKYIQEGPKYGTEEIAKILEAWQEEKPIEWVRIHNLPDHAYFNHAQHVVVGGLECQTCHGPIEEMEVVYQFSNLGMGWCINCHREEKVKVLGEETDMTVSDMGGLNCARCHY